MADQSRPSVPSVTVIVPVYRGGAAFEQCLASLVQADPPADRILVVADGGLEADRNTAEAFGLEVVSTPAAGGPGGARNRGAQHADTDLLFFVDADVTLAHDGIGRVREVFTAHPEVDAVFGSYDDEPAAPNFLSQYKNLLHHHVRSVRQVRRRRPPWCGHVPACEEGCLEAGQGDHRDAEGQRLGAVAERDQQEGTGAEPEGFAPSSLEGTLRRSGASVPRIFAPGR